MESPPVEVSAPGARPRARARRRAIPFAALRGAAWPLVRRYWDAAFVVLLPMFVYLGSMSTYPDGWDTGEMQTVPYMLGITHPTGFPTFTLLGWVFAHVFAFSTVAWRINVFCALALVVGLLSVRAIAIGLGANRYVASISAIAFGMTSAVWGKGIHADVHALAFAFIITSVLTLQRALVTRSPRWLTLSAALAGCAIGVHLTGIFLIPTLFVAAFVLRRELTRRTFLYGVLAFIAPVLSYLYLPIRSWMAVTYHLDPNLGLPFGEHTFGVDWGQFPIDSPLAFWRMMTGASEAHSYAWIVLNPLHWPGFVTDWVSRIGAEITVVVLFMALLGTIAVAAKRPLQLIVVAAGVAGVPFAIAYGAVEADVMRYLLPSFGMAMALAAVSPALIEAGLMRRIATVAFAALLAAVGVNEFASHRAFYGYHAGRGNQDAIDIVHDHVPDGAIVVSSWLDLTSLGYGKYIDGSLGSRLIIGGWPSDMLPDFRALTKTHEVYVLADFVIQPNLAQHVPLAWQHPLGTFGSHTLVQIVPTN